MFFKGQLCEIYLYSLILSWGVSGVIIRMAENCRTIDLWENNRS